MEADVIIPTLNEENGIGSTIDQVRLATRAANETLFRFDPIRWQIWVVDGLSSDKTAEVAAGHGANVLHEQRPGYGRAYKTGFARTNGEFLAVLDGDGTYPPKYVPWMLLHLLYHEKDIVVGNRLESRNGSGMPLLNRMGNATLSAAVRVLFPETIRRATNRSFLDIESGMWVMRRSVLPLLSLREDGTAFSQEIKLEALIQGVRYDEIPIPYVDRIGDTKTRPLRDGTIDMVWLVNRRLAALGSNGRKLSVPLPELD